MSRTQVAGRASVFPLALLDSPAQQDIFNILRSGTSGHQGRKESGSGHYRLSGKTHLVLTSHMGPHSENMRVAPFIREARILFELKSVLLEDAHERQAIGELLCASMTSVSEAIVCLTNGTEWQFFSVRGTVISIVAYESKDPPRVWTSIN